MDNKRIITHGPNVGAPIDSTDHRFLGFKCGLEIHQQLATDSKLFCRCPAVYVKDPHDGEILRHMRPTLSELGEYDGTALMEFKTKKDVTYQVFNGHVCTYEFDDTPPFSLNQTALDIVIHLSLMLGCSLVDEVHVSRKQYLDGSIPTGFQRTMIVGIEGSLPFDEGGTDRTLRIIQCALEEDACREVKDEGHSITFRTDRLSIPLIEVVTSPDLLTPAEVYTAAEKIGRWMRSTGLVRRGSGATRQDVNVSIEGGTRVEIKGVPNLDWIPMLVHNEALRQCSMLRLRELLVERGAAADTMQTSTADITGLLDGTGYRPIQEAVGSGGRVGAVSIGAFRGLLEHPTQPGRCFFDELAGRVRVIACLDGEPNILHTDLLPMAGFRETDGEAIRSLLGAREEDAVIFTWGPERDVKTALHETADRCREAFGGVPSETRQAFVDGITDFERILPGPNRMYPDTDVPPTAIDGQRVDAIRNRLALRPEELEAMAIEGGVSPQVAWQLAIHPLRLVFLEAIRRGAEPVAAAHVIVETLKHLKRKEVRIDNIPTRELEGLLVALKEGEVTSEIMPEILTMMARGDVPSWQGAMEAMGLEPADPETSRRVVQEVVESLRLEAGTTDLSHDAYMGAAMAALKGRVAGREVHRILLEVTGAADGK